jgi:hypothetical protein
MKFKKSVILAAMLPLMVSAKSDVEQPTDPVVAKIEQDIAEFVGKDDTDIEIKYDDISYYPKNQIVVISDVELIEGEAGNKITTKIDKISFSHIPLVSDGEKNTISIPEKGLFSVEGLYVNYNEIVAAAKAEVQAEGKDIKHQKEEIQRLETYLGYFAGDDELLSSDFNYQFQKSESSSFISSSSMSVENAGSLSITSEISGIYNVLNGKSMDDPNLAFQTMATVSIDDVQINFTTAKLRGITQLYLDEQGISMQDMLSNLENNLEFIDKNVTSSDNKFITSFRKDLMSAFKDGIHNNKELSVTFSLKNINMGTVMGLMQTQDMNKKSDYVLDVFDLDYAVLAL